MTRATLDYDEAVAALRRRGRFGIGLGLARIEALLDELGNPQRQLRGALVAGTNGKGSVLALAAFGAAEAGKLQISAPRPMVVKDLDDDVIALFLRLVEDPELQRRERRTPTPDLAPTSSTASTGARSR